MLVLKEHITLSKALVASPNICDSFLPDDLAAIGRYCIAGYEADRQSRTTWMMRNEAGMDLALQVSQAKTFPWPNASNVAFPLVTIAAMQFHARAYPAILNGNEVVKCEVNNPDPTGELQSRADRVGKTMSWQVLKEDKAWEEQEDRTLFNVAIVGTAFKKSYRKDGKNVSELVMAKDLVLDYWAKSVECCPRKTHLVPVYRNEVYEKVQRGTYRDVLEEAWYKAAQPAPKTPEQIEQDKRKGLQPPTPSFDSPFQFGEQHTDIDLDGDGYAERWIITFDINSKQVVRVVAGFNWEDIEFVGRGYKNAGEIIKIEHEEYFTKRSFIPSPDGGVYDIGFGVFLGPLNESVNTLINQLIDAGTMQTTSGGFLGRGAKLRGGTRNFGPFEWKNIDASGDDIKKSVFPLPVNEPSQVLFSLLSLLIDYTNRIAGTTDMMVGVNPGQNTPAYNAKEMVDQGSKIYTAIFKRVWRSLAEEFRKLYLLNRRYAIPGTILVGGATYADFKAPADDISPAADPNIVSDQQRLQQAMLLKQEAATTPGFDMHEVEMRVLKAMGVDAPERIFPGVDPKAPPPEDPKVTIKKMEIQQDQMRMNMENQHFTLRLLEDRKVNNAKIYELAALADQEAAKAQTEAAFAQAAHIEAMINAAQAENKRINDQIGHLLKAAEITSKHQIELKKLEQPSGIE